MSTIPDWLFLAIEKFQAQGFFDSAPTRTIAQEVITQSIDSYFGTILDLEEDPLFLQVLSSYDKKRVWFMEDSAILGSTEPFKEAFYLQVFKHLEAISMGIFSPKQVELKECGYCQGRDKRLNIQFKLQNNLHEVNFCVDLDVLILSFLDEINELLAAKEYAFEVIQDPYGPCFVLFLSYPQKQWLLETLDWKFESHDNYWLDRAQFARDKDQVHQAMAYFKKAILSKNSFAFSEYANFLMDQNQQDLAIETYKKGLQVLKESTPLDQTQQWWWDNFEGALDFLSKKT